MATPMKRAWKLQEFVAHGSDVNCLALGNKSGRVLVTGGDDKKVNLWAVGKSNCIMSLSGHTTPIECVRFGNSEELVCAGSLSGALKIWDLEAAKILRTLTGHKAKLGCIDFHPYGDFVASGSADSNIKLWDIRRKGCIFTYKGHKHSVNSLKFSPDGRWIASAGEDGAVKLWDLHVGKMLAEFSGHSAPVNDVQFHPNDFLLASGSTDKTIKYWDLESFQLVSTSELDNSAIRCIYFNPGGECLYSGSQDFLKVYGWEPARTFDAIDVKWGKVSTISTSQNQLIGASYHMMQVSVFIIDLKKVKPFGSCSSEGKYSADTKSSMIPGTPMRKSFCKRLVTSSKNSKSIQMITSEDRESSPIPDTEFEENNMSPAVINDPGDYRAIFQPRRRELTRTPPIEIFVTPFPAPPEAVEPVDVETQRTMPQSPPVIDVRQSLLPRPDIVRPEPIFNRQPTDNVIMRSRSETLISKPLKETSRVPCIRLESNSVQTEFFKIEHLSKVERTLGEPPLPSSPQPQSPPSLDSLRLNTVDSNVTHAVPVSAAPRRYEREPDVVMQSRNRPDLLSIKSQEYESEKMERVDFVPTQRDRSVGLDLDEFLPQNMRFSDPMKLNCQQQPEMSEAEAISSIIKGHDSMIAVMNNRLRNVQIIYTLWTNKDLKARFYLILYAFF
ncbi:Katanin p80 WD40 repeat-containing subunit B1, variant 2 [Chamberlinius hualienensis]